jgi:hypothetical protein
MRLRAGPAQPLSPPSTAPPRPPARPPAPPQRDTEEADIAKEREQQARGPAARAHELDELTQARPGRGRGGCGRGLHRPMSLPHRSSPQIYVSRGLDRELARRVAEQLSEKVRHRGLAGPEGRDPASRGAQRAVPRGRLAAAQPHVLRVRRPPSPRPPSRT